MQKKSLKEKLAERKEKKNLNKKIKELAGKPNPRSIKHDTVNNNKGNMGGPGKGNLPNTIRQRTAARSR